jgi:hypothetical protein
MSDTKFTCSGNAVVSSEDIYQEKTSEEQDHQNVASSNEKLEWYPINLSYAAYGEDILVCFVC